MSSILFKGLNLAKIVSGAKSSMTFVNKAIPIYKQVTPTIKNVKSALNSVNSIKKAAKDAAIKEIKSFERPSTIFRKHYANERGKINLDNIRFFK